MLYLKQKEGAHMPTKQTEWSRAYVEKAYDRISVTVKKGKKAIIESAAKSTGESVNGLINRLLDEYISKLEQ